MTAAAAAADLQLPPGFRFHPTDEELVMHYLCRKCASQSISVPIIAEIDLYKYDPWDLPGLALYGEKEWYFFSPRERKYPNGSRPNRAAGTGYWKATGADKPIGKPKPVGIKKALVFYSGKAPKGDKTNWIMHEYRLADVDRSVRKKNNSLRLDDWVLCRIYNKKGKIERRPPPANGTKSDFTAKVESAVDMKLETAENTFLRPPTASAASDYINFNASDSVPRLHTESSCSEHTLSPEFTSEVQSQLRWKDWGKKSSNNRGLNFTCNYMNATVENSVLGGVNQMSPLQDMFMYLQKPF